MMLSVMYMKIVYDFFVAYWDKVIPIVISIIALVISIIGWISQYNFSKKYSKQTDIVISNSILLALYDIDLLIFKVNHVDDSRFDKAQLLFQIESLKDNLRLVKSMRLDQLSVDSTLNYQTYLKDLREIIYKLESDIEKFGNELETTDDETATRIHWRKAILKSLFVTRKELKKDSRYINGNKNIFEKKYRKAYESMDKEAESKEATSIVVPVDLLNQFKNEKDK